MSRRIRNISHILKGPVALIFALLMLYGFLSSSGYHVGWNLVTGNPITYESEQYCYSFQYPGRWKLYTSGDEGWHGGVSPYQRAMILGNITYTIYQVPMDQPSLEDVANWSILYRSRKNQEVNGTSLEPFIIDNKPALTRTFDATSEVYIARENDGLVLRVVTKNRKNAMDDFQKFLNTFKYDSCIS